MSMTSFTRRYTQPPRFDADPASINEARAMLRNAVVATSVIEARVRRLLAALNAIPEPSQYSTPSEFSINARRHPRLRSLASNLRRRQRFIEGAMLDADDAFPGERLYEAYCCFREDIICFLDAP